MTALAEIDDAERLAVGGNTPPIVSTDELAAENAEALKSVADLLAEARALPAEVTDDETDGRVTDVVRALQNTWKQIEATREDRKAPLLAACRTVDSFFKGSLLEKLEKIKTVLESRLTVWKRKKADTERRRLAEEARKAAEAAAELRAAADRERQEAEAAAAFEDTAATLAPEQNATVKAANDAALNAAIDARQAAQAAAVKPADLARNRSSSGAAISTLVETWAFEIDDLNAVSLDALRPFIPRADIEKAIRRYVAVNKGDRPLAGVRIYPEENARVSA